MDLEGLLQNNRTIQVIGFDDEPFVRRSPFYFQVCGAPPDLIAQVNLRKKRETVG
uniref:hypothetical protein n=1 Tax=Trichocoleus desertorum TaxID=1481672 RepID=UPI0025B5CB5C|nr:hypothetical protein [Trichocoleus desertorum]